MPTWTRQQRDVIDSRGQNLLVSAAAGSGKTTVMVARILSLIEEGASIERMLVVTFTNAAASSMRAKIMTELERRTETSPSAHVRRQIALVREADISTLHAFCAAVLRSHYALAGLSPSFRVGDAALLHALREKAMDEVLQQEYEQKDRGFLQLMGMFATPRGDMQARAVIEAVYTYTRSQPYPEAWLRRACEAYGDKASLAGHAPWGEALLFAARSETQAVIGALRACAVLCAVQGGPAQYLQAVEADIAALAETESCGDWESFARLAQRFAFARLGGKAREGDSAALREEAKSLRDGARRQWDALMKRMAPLLFDGANERVAAMANAMAALYRVVTAYGGAYREKKRDKNVLDFADMEHEALFVLRQIGEVYREKFEYVFMDEYQDANAVQEALIHCLVRGDNLFLVGDVKQSIYRFRLADVTLFQQKLATYQKESGARERRIDLKDNFRSGAGVLHAANHVFSRVMRASFGGVDYDEAAMLCCGRGERQSDALPVLRLTQGRGGAADDLLSEEDNVAAEARSVAQCVAALLSGEVYDASLGAMRAVQKKDIVILMRAFRAASGAYVAALGERGIAAVSSAASGEWAQGEVASLLALLQLIDNRQQDLPYLAVLPSAFVGLSAEQLARIRLHGGADAKTPFYQAVARYAQTGEDASAREKIAALLTQLSRWKRHARSRPLASFVRAILSETDFEASAAARAKNPMWQENLERFLRHTEQFAREIGGTLSDFLQWIERQRQSGEDMVPQLGEGEDAVRVMSIHASKGLEFPIVIVAGLGRSFNRMDASAPVLMHKTLGLGVPYHNPDTRLRTALLPRTAIALANRRESLEEELRLLYVAMTRAKEQLILSACVNALGAKGARWAHMDTDAAYAQAQCLLDWIAPAVLRHPDGENLRAYCGVAPVDTGEGDTALAAQSCRAARWRVDIVGRSGAAGATLCADQGEAPPVCADGDHPMAPSFTPMPLSAELARRFLWRYPYAERAALPSKLSVSEIVRLAGAADHAAPLSAPPPGAPFAPDAPEEEHVFLATPRPKHGALSAAQRGTLMHFLCQHIDVHAVTVAAVEADMAGLVERGLLTESMAREADVRALAALFSSPLGERMRCADEIWRERPFTMLVPSEEIFPGAPGEKILVQGVIDCLLREGESWVIIDYKTDHAPGDGREIVARYRRQLQWYARAVEAIDGRRVTSCLLYLFALGYPLDVW